MANILRKLFERRKSKKDRKNFRESPPIRFSDDCRYYTHCSNDASTLPRSPKDEFYRHRKSLKNYVIDQHCAEEEYSEIRNQRENIKNLKQKSAFYMQKWKESERKRREDLESREKIERELNMMRIAVSNMAFSIEFARKMEDLQKEIGYYQNETEKYRNKCENLETLCNLRDDDDEQDDVKVFRDEERVLSPPLSEVSTSLMSSFYN
uniref:Uncharacterized protein n=1 Tax=Caenorhabditis japonica TaxID=281687 RepID=A0A8R1EBQ8_CAEJA